MKTRFAIGGAISGALFSAGVSVDAVLKGPGTPGFYELLVLALIAGIFAAVGALLGLFLGWLVCLCVGRK